MSEVRTPGYARWKRWLPALALVLAGMIGGGWAYLASQSTPARAGVPEPSDASQAAAEDAKPSPKKDDKADRREKTYPAPELEGGVEWLNTGGPIRMKDLKGKIVLLDFWTYCCINCIHVMPDLARLEKKYANQLVVIGVHSAKFDTEKDSKNIREAILRYHIEHPVVNDANHRIWRAYHVQSWPTFWLIDPEGNLYGRVSGEGLYDLLDQHIDKLAKLHREKKTLNEQPVRFDLAKFRERKDAPIYFPGKVLADARGNRLFIADSSHHRIVVTDLEGKKLDIIGTGEDGQADGPFDQATFNDPQGMALHGGTLYVADRKNHLLRAVDLAAKTVRTVAGTGKQGHERQRGGDARSIGLNSPWDLWLEGETLYIAMAGHHQIWRMNLKTKTLSPFAGNGREDIYPAASDKEEGTLVRSMFAQPSGLASDGEWLYVADSEVSAVRAISLKPDGVVKTLVGEGLFDFADIDGPFLKARLQHCLAVAVYDRKVLVADTYNNKIKLLDPATQTATTFLGDGKPGKEDQPPRFDEPAGLSVAGDQLYVADTNNHAIRVVNLKTKAVRTLKLEGVTPPSPRPPKVAARPEFPNPETTKLAETVVPHEGELTLEVKLNLANGFKLSPLAPLQYLVEGVSANGSAYERIGDVDKPSVSFGVKVPADKLSEVKTLKLSLAYFVCQEGGEGLCQVKSHIWEIPLRRAAEAKNRTISLSSGNAAGQ